VNITKFVLSKTSVIKLFAILKNRNTADSSIVVFNVVYKTVKLWNVKLLCKSGSKTKE
jgi:hypothetical protein